MTRILRILLTKRRLRIAVGALSFVLALAIVNPAIADEPVAPAEFNATAGEFVKKYCIKCHAGPEPKGELSLDRYTDVKGMLQDREVWEKVVENLTLGVMPPDGNELPQPDAVRLLVGWINEQFAAADRSASPNPGHVTMRRLNRVEYNNTIRDLVGVDFQPGNDFPSDDVGYGFDNIGDVLSISPLLMEKYLAAAERVAAQAIVTDRDVRPTVRRVEVERLRRAQRSSDRNSVVLASVGEVGTKFAIAHEGEYVIRVGAYADQAGPENARMAIKLEGQELATFDVPATSVEPGQYEVRTKLESGDKRIEAAFLNDYYRPDDSDPANRDRNLYVDYIEVEGPFNAEPISLPESHRRIITTQPNKIEGVAREAEWDRAAREVLARFATRAFRRPVTDNEIDRLAALVQLGRAEGENFEAAIQLAVQAVLVSPHFLFLVETNEREPNAPGPVDAADGSSVSNMESLTDFQLASRLSYFLWSSMPDDVLFAEAKAGKLREPEHWEAQVRRMLADPKSLAIVENFAGQWLQLRNLKTINPDRKRFPDFDESLRTAMQRETELFLAEIIREDRSVLDLLDADFTFVNERLAKHYGIDGIKGDEFQRVTVDPARRGGVLTQASVLTVTSNPTRTSPVKRGKWVLEQIFNAAPPPPPPDVPELADDSGKPLTGTLRERMQQHRANVSCAACHQRMDPIGFGLENFDAIGAYRERDGEFPIDPSGELPDGSKFSGPAELKQIFRAKAADFRRALAAKMLTYALGRGTEPFDRPALEKIAAELEADGDRFSRLIVAVTTSQPFQMRQVSSNSASSNAATVNGDAGGDD